MSCHNILQVDISGPYQRGFDLTSKPPIAGFQAPFHRLANAANSVLLARRAALNCFQSGGPLCPGDLPSGGIRAGS